MNNEWQGNYKYFTEDEMRCKCGKCNTLPKHSFMLKLDKLRHLVGFPLIINSGARCLEYNKFIGGGPAHEKGKAADIQIYGLRALQILHVATRLGFKGFGVKQHSDHYSRFIHVDTLENTENAPRPTIWSYK